MIWILCIFAFIVSGCQQNPQERHYTEVVVESTQDKIPNSPMAMGTPVDPHAGVDMASMPMPSGDNKPTSKMFTWIVPEGWKEEAGQGFRLATFHLKADEKAIDCSMVTLGGSMAGGLEANLQRWMGQIGIKAAAEDFSKLMTTATSLKMKQGQEGKIYDFSSIQSSRSSTDKSMIVVVVTLNDSTLFVKMTGTIATIKKNKENFLLLVQSIEPSSNTLQAGVALTGMNVAATTSDVGLNMVDPHAGLDMAAMGADMPGAVQRILDWDLPEGWVEEKARSMRLATFHSNRDSKAIDCSIISLAGTAGGMEANLNRWLVQIGLSSSKESLEQLNSSAQSFKTKGGFDVKIYNFNILKKQTEASAKSMMVAMLPINNTTVFVKMTGSVEDLNDNQKAFSALVKSLRQP